MRHRGFMIGRYRVRSMMKSAHLIPVWKRKFVRTTDSKHTGRIAPNLVQQDFRVSRKECRVGGGHHLHSHAKWLALLGCGDGFICP